MSRSDLPAAIEAAELHVHAADGNVEFAANRLRQGWTRRRRPVTNIAKVALPLLAVIWLVRKKRTQTPRNNGLYYMGPMQPVKTNFVMGLLAAAVATRALWVPVLSAVLAEMQRRRANGAQSSRRYRGVDHRGADHHGADRSVDERAAPPTHGYPGTAGTANVGSDPRVEAGYH